MFGMMQFSRIASHMLPALGFVLLAAGSTETQPDKFEPVLFDEISAKVYCEEPIKKLLRDPDSYQFDSASVLNSKVAIINFRAKNGFGGYNNIAAKCTTYVRNQQNWFQAELME